MFTPGIKCMETSWRSLKPTYSALKIVDSNILNKDKYWLLCLLNALIFRFPSCYKTSKTIPLRKCVWMIEQTRTTNQSSCGACHPYNKSVQQPDFSKYATHASLRQAIQNYCMQFWAKLSFIPRCNCNRTPSLFDGYVYAKVMKFMHWQGFCRLQSANERLCAIAPGEIALRMQPSRLDYCAGCITLSRLRENITLPPGTNCGVWKLDKKCIPSTSVQSNRNKRRVIVSIFNTYT
jgi:hypothetical protein